MHQEGEGNETTHRSHPFFTHIHLLIDSEAQLAKKKQQKNKQKKNIKVHKMDNFFSYCVKHLQLNFKNQLSTNHQCLRTTSAAYGVFDYK